MTNIGCAHVVVLRNVMGGGVGVGGLVHLTLVPRLVVLVQNLFVIEW